MNTKRTLAVVACALTLYFSDSDKFSKDGWSRQGDLGSYPLRDGLLRNLIGNYRLKGMSRGQLMELIGTPDKNLLGERDEICYPILTEYRGIHPVRAKTLVFVMDGDSVATYRIHEWNR